MSMFSETLAPLNPESALSEIKIYEIVEPEGTSNVTMAD
jgi:hypothetical protein